ncbi:hypothetical protein P0082_11815 [Candidatus Haliotispira prima]|uniref:Uncharacterized protein n=1 Tax=Candidatus Haliotispira prima TaxID=3034016 RepID=A0ABY8MGS9_9SPIO|nr:hypothetical protein P0082_11815 [Candidatus Haliotispira prima]
MLGCTPLSNTSQPPAAPVNPTISFSSSAVASSLQLELSSNVELANIGAVIRLATEAAPTETEALASKGHVSISIPADATRKISISQHYLTNFDDGLTIADVLAPNTAYKLYLYFPAERITTTAEITGLSITNDRALVSFTTAALPAEGDAAWGNGNGSNYVASLDNLYFMEEQTGVVVCYFYINFTTLLSEFSIKNGSDGTYDNIGTYARNIATPGPGFHFAHGFISGYTANSTNRYGYWIGADKVANIHTTTRHTFTNGGGVDIGIAFIPVTRH